MYEYRVFISYSHDDYSKVKKIDKALKENNMIPMWDPNLPPGHGFTDEIKNFIAYSHVFLPVISKTSVERGWVQQEIGFAMASNIPIVPVMLGQVPEGMISHINAVEWTENFSDLKELLSWEKFHFVVRNAKSIPLFLIYNEFEDRTKMMTNYANKVADLAKIAKVENETRLRQRGDLTSFDIPNLPVFDPLWKQRSYPAERSEYKDELLLKKRQALELHARSSGCCLIINPYGPCEQMSVIAKVARLTEVLKFLKSLKNNQIKVAINKEASKARNLTIIGDWFSAESFSHGGDYNQLIFSTHAPTVQQTIQSFDYDLEYLLNQQGDRNNSREIVISELERILEDLFIQMKILKTLKSSPHRISTSKIINEIDISSNKVKSNINTLIKIDLIIQDSRDEVDSNSDSATFFTNSSKTEEIERILDFYLDSESQFDKSKTDGVQTEFDELSTKIQPAVYMCYSSEDRYVADEICSKLEEANISCWNGQRNIEPGLNYEENIIKAINDSNVFLLIFSSDSNKSPYVIKEVERALNNKMPIIPFRIEDVQPSKSMEYFISNVHWFDAFSSNREQAIQKLIEILNSLLNTTDKKPPEIDQGDSIKPKSNDFQPFEYHDYFWKCLKQYPLIENAFIKNNYDWEKLPLEQRDVCKACDQLARANLKQMKK